MSPANNALRRAFTAPTHLLVRVSRDGFLIHDELVTEIFGRVRTTRLLRKLFKDGALVCDSTDGVVARNGTRCAECAHPRCRPALRLTLVRDCALYVLDLSAASARNFFAIEDQAAACGADIEAWTLRATVLARDTWGEVTFDRN